MQIKNKHIILLFSVILVLYLSTFFSNNNFQFYIPHRIQQNPNLTDYHLGSAVLFDDSEAYYVNHAEETTKPRNFDLTNIAQKGSNYYFQYLETANLKYAQLALYHANFLLSEGNFNEKDNCIFFPNHIGGSIFNITWNRNYLDGMGASYAAILFIDIDELLVLENITNTYYLEAAEKVVNGVLLNAKQGGSIINLTENEIWFTHHSEEKRVLNGHMYTLANLIRYANYTNEIEILKYVEKGINTLRNEAGKYIRHNKQFYNRKTLVENSGYDKYFSPYYSVHPLLFYYLSDSLDDLELYNFYEVFLESSLFECKYALELQPFIQNSSLYLSINFNSQEYNLLTNGTSNSFSLNPLHEYLYRAPVSNFSKLGHLNLQIKIQQKISEEFFTYNLHNQYSFPTQIHLIDLNLTNSEIEIEVLSEMYKSSLTFNLIDDQIENEKLQQQNIFKDYYQNKATNSTGLFVSLPLVFLTITISFLFIKFNNKR